MLHQFKTLAYRVAASSGMFALVAQTPWRRARLAILCYHGISLDDEHRWSPGLYLPDSVFRSRLECLRRSGCAVLPLGEALERLRNGTLPPRSVAITFDDGFYDFYARATPVLREYGVPATVYVSTYYAVFSRPVFSVMLSYLLWKCAGRTLHWPKVVAGRIELNQGNLDALWKNISEYAEVSNLSGAEKDTLLNELADRLQAAEEYGDMLSRRILQFMNPDEIHTVAAQGFDIQLHTHRHRMPRDRALLVREIEENRETLKSAVSGEFRHFCYPSGVYHEDSAEFLRECGILSATTCVPGLATRRQNPFQLPRFLDSAHTTELTFTAWTTGASEWFPRRRE